MSTELKLSCSLILSITQSHTVTLSLSRTKRQFNLSCPVPRTSCSCITVSSRHFHSAIVQFGASYSIPVQRRGISTLAGWDTPSSFFAMTVAMILSPLKVAICERLTGAAEVSGEKISVCCRFSSGLQKVTS